MLEGMGEECPRWPSPLIKTEENDKDNKEDHIPHVEEFYFKMSMREEALVL